MRLAVLYDAGVHLPAFHALKASLFHHQVSRHHWWGFVVLHTSSVVFSKPVLSFAQISSVVVANAPFSIIFSKVFKISLKFFFIFSMLSKNRKRCHDLKKSLWSKGLTSQYFLVLKMFSASDMIFMYSNAFKNTFLKSNTNNPYHIVPEGVVYSNQGP